MTSEEPIDVEPKKSGDNNFAETPESNKTDKKQDRVRQTNELMKLVYEIPDDLDSIENNNMLKENPPITILEITEQNGCETELDSTRECDSDVTFTVIDGSSPELGNKVVYDDVNTEVVDEFREVIDRSTPDDCTDEELEELKKLLESKPKVLERYIREYATTDEVNRLHSLTSSGPLSPRPHHEARSTSVTSDLFQLWLSSSPVKVSDNVYHEVIVSMLNDCRGIMRPFLLYGILAIIMLLVYLVQLCRNVEWVLKLSSFRNGT